MKKLQLLSILVLLSFVFVCTGCGDSDDNGYGSTDSKEHCGGCNSNDVDSDVKGQGEEGKGHDCDGKCDGKCEDKCESKDGCGCGGEGKGKCGEAKDSKCHGEKGDKDGDCAGKCEEKKEAEEEEKKCGCGGCGK